MSLGVYNGVNNGTQNGSYAGADIGVTSGLVTEFFDVDIPRRNLLSYIDAGNKGCYPIDSTGLLGRDLVSSTAGLSLSAPFTFDYSNKGCIKFPGTANQRLSTGVTAAVIGASTSNFTWGGWFQVARTDGTKEGNFFGRGRDGTGGWSLLLGTTLDGYFRIGSVTTSPSTVGNFYQSTIQASLNTWYHLIGIHQNGVGLSMYINGVFIAFQPFTGTVLRPPTSFGWIWGSNSSVATSQLEGKVAITYAWERVLSPNEIMQVFLAHKQRFLKP